VLKNTKRKLQWLMNYQSNSVVAKLQICLPSESKKWQYNTNYKILRVFNAVHC